jgi:small subunit ribosomal protein S6
VHTYETLFIVNPDLDESEINKAIEAVQDVITAGGGKVLKVDIWGRRQLAYMIQKKTDGFYVLIYFEAPATLIAEMNRRYKLADAIMRYLVVQLNKVQIAEVFDEESAAKKAARERLSSDEDLDEDEYEGSGPDNVELVASTED